MKAGYEKPIVYNNKEPNSSYEPFLVQPSTTPKTNIPALTVCIAAGVTRRALFIMICCHLTKQSNSEKYCPQLDNLKGAIEQEYPELGNRKHVIFLRIILDNSL